jgi:HAMP domain-containing protein
MKITSKLLIIFLEIALIPIVIFGFVSYSSAKNELTAQIVSKLEVVADIQKSRLESANKENLTYLTLLTERLLLKQEIDTYMQSPTRQTQANILESLTETRDAVSSFREISVVNLTGEVIVSTNPDSLGKNISQEPYFQKGLTTKSVTDFAKDGTGVVRLYFAGPLMVDNKTIGVLVVNSEASGTTGIVSTYSGLGQTGETLLATKDARGDALFLAPVRFDKTAALTRVVPKGKINVPSTHAVDGEELIMLDAVDYNNIPVIAVTRYIPETRWGIVVKMSQKEAYATIGKLRTLLMFMGSVSLAIIALISLTVARSFTDPIKKLSQFADELSHHKNFTTTTISINSHDEIGVLARSFNTMNTQLKDYFGEIEQKVKVRTSELEAKTKDLEKMNKLMVDREMKMIELKGEIETLKKT